MYRVIPDERPLIEQTLKDLVRLPSPAVAQPGGRQPAPLPRVFCQVTTLFHLDPTSA